MSKRILFIFLLPIVSLLANIPLLEEITDTPVNEWIQSGDRWTFKDRFEEKRDEIFPILEAMEIFEAMQAENNHYNTAIVLGALHNSVQKRIGHLIDEWNRGVRFDQVVFLTGQRPLHVEKEKELLHLSSETEMMIWTWKHADMDEELRALPLLVIDAPALPDRGRPTTASTVDAYLETHPQGGSLLIFSSQPYVRYQHAVLTTLLPSNFAIETIGPAGGKALPISVLLDNLSKKSIWEEKSR